eukprot:CAMPEP_0171231726 /NCGR_PEP_ID=MMETSP0790-20130122/40046_1 /TAXON_ID=2925 /ORGANISM="Alexandrium catenella, Strain OF101" /LENGTH=227 /DNA_ID=CAMNT_0011697949 /DNA_START=156 /DNA_END=836 /DNA_ORIENTATION=+
MKFRGSAHLRRRCQPRATRDPQPAARARRRAEAAPAGEAPCSPEGSASVEDAVAVADHPGLLGAVNASFAAEDLASRAAIARRLVHLAPQVCSRAAVRATEAAIALALDAEALVSGADRPVAQELSDAAAQARDLRVQAVAAARLRGRAAAAEGLEPRAVLGRVEHPLLRRSPQLHVRLLTAPCEEHLLRGRRQVLAARGKAVGGRHGRRPGPVVYSGGGGCGGWRQ